MFFEKLPRELRNQVYRELGSPPITTPPQYSPRCQLADLQLVSKQFKSELLEEIGRPEHTHQHSVTYTYTPSGRPQRTLSCVANNQPFTLTCKFNGYGHDVPTAVTVWFQSKTIPITRPVDILIQGNSKWETYGASAARYEYVQERMSSKGFRWDDQFYRLSQQKGDVSLKEIFVLMKGDIEAASLHPVGWDDSFFSTTMVRYII